jgi:hypothetical protein
MEIKDMFIKYNLIYYRVNLVRLEQAILTGSYKLSFFWVRKELERYPIKMDRLTFYRFESLDDDYWQLYLTLKLEDELILISLANLLKKYVFTKNLFLEQSFAGQTDKLFVAKIRSWSNLRVLFVIDFSIYSKILCRKRLLDKIKPLIEDPFILNLIESFLHSPVLDKAGKNLALKGGIPPVRFINSIFLNFFLDDMDRKFLSKFPGATFARFSHQLLIPIGTDKSRNNIRVRDLEKAFLAELDSGIILNILKPGDGKVVSCKFGNLLLNKYGIPIVSM